jgi:prepilin-type N-terminal cleavage/methylation domain-containing protein
MKTLSKSSQRGYSLIELSIALAIVGVVIAGSIVGVQAILTSNNVNKTIKQTNWAVGKVVSKLVRDSDWSKATVKTLTTTGFDVWNDDDVKSAGTTTAEVTHFLGGRVFVLPSSVGDGTSTSSYGIDKEQGLVYTLTGIPTGGCADLAAGLEGIATAMTVKNQAASGITGASSLVITDVIKDNKPLGSRFDSVVVNDKCNGIVNGVVSAGSVGTATIAVLIQRR